MIQFIEENQSTGSPNEKKDLSAENIFEELSYYPITKEPTRFPKIRPPATTDSIHNLVYTNLTNIIPNIDIGFQMNMETNQIMDWIEKTKQYSIQLNNEFQKQCEKKMQKLIKIEEHKERAKVLDMNKLDLLPEDIIRYIHDFLMPETRIVLLRARYPNLYINLLKLRSPQLKKFSENIMTKYYRPMMNTLYKHNRGRCLPKGFYMRFGFTKKADFLNNVTKFMGTCETAVAHTPSDYRYFQRKTLRILKSLIYVAKYKHVLEKPYAPELEVPMPAKKPRKPRTKKQG
jgi:hypothetical protein